MLAPPWLPVPPPSYGGTEAVIDRLARGVVAAGHDVFLWTTGDSTCAVQRGHVLRWAVTERIGSAVIELRHLIRGYEALRGWGADIIHDHTIVGPVYAHRYDDLPVVTTSHGPFNEELIDLYRTVAPAVPVIAISHDQAAHAAGFPVAQVIHHGIDVEEFPFGQGEGDDEGEYFLFLGRMAPEKGARQAALAARELGVRLLMAAKMREPLEHAFYQEQVQPLLGDGISYVGEVGHQERVRLLQGARALVNPIRWSEPFGLVMAEALACGTPVIAFREGSTPELVDHGVTGYLCDVDDDLAKRMAEVSQIDRKACRAAAGSRFSTERMVNEHLALYQRLLERAA